MASGRCTTDGWMKFAQYKFLHGSLSGGNEPKERADSLLAAGIFNYAIVVKGRRNRLMAPY